MGDISLTSGRDSPKGENAADRIDGGLKGLKFPKADLATTQHINSAKKSGQDGSNALYITLPSHLQAKPSDTPYSYLATAKGTVDVNGIATDQLTFTRGFLGANRNITVSTPNGRGFTFSPCLHDGAQTYQVRALAGSRNANRDYALDLRKWHFLSNLHESGLSEIAGQNPILAALLREMQSVEQPKRNAASVLESAPAQKLGR